LGRLTGEVEQELERILANSLFRTSRRLSAFLRFAVEKTNTGQVHLLKEYIIGVEVFERGTSYSPQEDPIVRIMAGRLRSKLAEYYQGPGRSDSVVIEIPKGAYLPRYTRRQQTTFSENQAAIQRHRYPIRANTVGRDEQLNLLRKAFESVSAGRGMIVTLAGEAGIGKTTTIEDFLAEIEAQFPAVRIGRGRCSERLAETDAFGPVFESLSNLIRGERGTEEVMKAAAPTWYMHVAPFIGESPGIPATEFKSYERMRREFIAFLEQLSRTRPVVLFLDDLHWADASTCDLLAYLGVRIRSASILILLAYRPTSAHDQHHPFLPMMLNLQRQEACEELRLPFLSRDDIGRYIAAQFPANRFPEEFAKVIHDRTEGNPLFMVDTLRFLVDRRVLVAHSEGWHLEQKISEIRKLIPAGVDSMIRLKIEQLNERDRRILQCASVQGIQFDSAVIAKVLSLDPADVEERLQKLELSSNFVRQIEEGEFANGVLSVQYCFVHVFYQNVLYASLAPSRRGSYSGAVARALVSLAGETSRSNAADLALLFEAARDYAYASQYFLKAANNTANVFAYSESGILCERGLRVLLTLPESQERDDRELSFSLILAMSLRLTRGYATPELEERHRRVRELCLKLNDHRRLLFCLWSRIYSYLNSGKLLKALEVAQEMRDLCESSEHSIGMHWLPAFGSACGVMGRWTEARDAFERFFATCPPESQRTYDGAIFALDVYSVSLSQLARVLAFMGHLDQAVEKSRESIELATRISHPPTLGYTTLYLGMVRHARGEYEESCRLLEMAMALSREQPLTLELERVIRGSALARLGRVSEGISDMRAGLEHLAAANMLVDRPYFLMLLAEALAGEGTLEEALSLCDEALEITRRTEGRCFEPEIHRVRGEILLSLGRDAPFTDAEAEFQCALQLARQMECRVLELRAAISYFRLHQRLGNDAPARIILADVINWFTEGLDSPVLLAGRKLLAEPSVTQLQRPPHRT
jgi:tetratricopeptide (TPR) repeat protein